MATKLFDKAKKNKADEFYTRLYDIEIELKHYKNYFKDKVVFCNCDDPFESNFFKYFALNFNYFGRFECEDLLTFNRHFKVKVSWINWI